MRGGDLDAVKVGSRIVRIRRADLGSLVQPVRAPSRTSELAALPLLDVMNAHADLDAHVESEYGWEQLASLERTEVYQATGMLIAALDVDATEALVRLRANAYARGMTASELAWEIVERRVDLHDDRRRERRELGRRTRPA